MLVSDILCERAVESSWIRDLRFSKKQRLITLTVASGRVYTIVGATPELYQKWVDTSSKGKFFHQYIKGKFKVWRVK
jgi:hypothetical protein